MTDAAATAAPMANERRDFWVACTYQDEGTIRDGEGKVLLSFDPSNDGTRFLNSRAEEVYVIRREGTTPFSRWLLFRAGVHACTIRRRGLWRSKYTIDFTNGRKWTVRLPLFTVWYTSISDQGEQFRFRLVQHVVWWVERLPEPLDLSFLAGLAVIQRERWWA
jgi:hypothetical protein